MKTINDINEDDLRELFGSAILIRGKEYFEEGAVTEIEQISDTSIAGTVEGNSDYNVTISIDEDEDILCECSCPCDFNCKHEAALLLKWLSLKGKSAKMHAAKPKEPIHQVLAKKSNEELIELLETFVKKHPDLKPLIKVESGEIVSKIRSLFSKFWDWREVSGLISQLETILESVERSKSSWDKSLFEDIKLSAAIMIKNIENVHDEGDVGIFLEDWFKMMGEIFAKTNPSKDEKQAFIEYIIKLMGKDDYGLDSSYEKAFVGMCSCAEDIDMIKKAIETRKPKYQHDEDRNDETEDDNEEDEHDELYLELYEKAGLDEEYIKFAKKSGFEEELIDKFVSLGQLDKALKECEKAEFSELIEEKKIKILKLTGRAKEAKNALLALVKRTDDFRIALMLKKETSKEEWARFFKEITAYAKGKRKHDFLSKLYCEEADYLKAYEYSNSISNADYLESLAKKLGAENPGQASSIYRKLCFKWVDAGSGWPYKKAGEMLAAIKKLDKNGKFFNKVKNEIISRHKKKYSLMQIIERI